MVSSQCGSPRFQNRCGGLLQQDMQQSLPFVIHLSLYYISHPCKQQSIQLQQTTQIALLASFALLVLLVPIPWSLAADLHLHSCSAAAVMLCVAFVVTGRPLLCRDNDLGRWRVSLRKQ
jgi:hypothetical protein